MRVQHLICSLQNKKEWIKGLLCFGMTVGFVYALGCHVHLLINETDSLPQRFFLQLPKIKPKLNDYTVVWSHWYKWKVIKKVIGISGDKIWFDDNGQMLVNEFRVGIPFSKGSDGRGLKAIPSQIIPEGVVFLYAPHARSFDSRYQELGLVPVSSLQGLVIPLG